MGHLAASIAAVRQAVRDFLQQRLADAHLRPGDLILVGCSGGPDSVALASQVAFWAPRMSIRAGLVTVNHQMQESSDVQAQRVVHLGKELGLSPSFEVKAQRRPGADNLERATSETTGPNTRLMESSGKGEGPEGFARQLRYSAFADALSTTGAVANLLGHTMEDQAETVLLGLARGAGSRTLAGMAPVRNDIWRPLLRVRRAETKAACDELNLVTWQDPTNYPGGPWRTVAGGSLPRAAVRHRVLPELARALEQDPVPALARTADLARADADYLEQAAEECWSLVTVEEGTVSADVSKLSELPPALRWRILRRMMLQSGAPGGQTSMTHVHAVDALIVDWRGQGGMNAPGGVVVTRTCGRLVMTIPTQER